MKNRIRSSISQAVLNGMKVLKHRPPGTRVLCYHGISDTGPGSPRTVTVDLFKSQMAYLWEKGYRTISLATLISGQAGDKEIAVTFDDGYADNYHHAFGIMRHFGYTGTVFLVSDWVGQEGYLRPDQIREMKQAGFEFGSHTINHLPLKGLDRIKKLDEIFGSKRRLEDLLDDECRYFCYPEGQYDRDAVKIVQQAGYEAACCNQPGKNEKVNPFLIHRTEIAAKDTLDDFEKKLSGASDRARRPFPLLRGRP